MEVCHLALKGKGDGFPGNCSLSLNLERNTSGFHQVCITLPTSLEKDEIILISIQLGNIHNANFFYMKPLRMVAVVVSLCPGNDIKHSGKYSMLFLSLCLYSLLF
jgi:hypothetical protein